jgi:hypothetical protein
LGAEGDRGRVEGAEWVAAVMTPEQIAAEMVPDPEHGEYTGRWWTYLTSGGDDGLVVALWPADDATSANEQMAYARGIIERLVLSIREESAEEIRGLTEQKEAFARKAFAYLEQRLPCGHTVADLAWAPGHITRCAACVNSGGMDTANECTQEMEGLRLYRAWFAAHSKGPFSEEVAQARRDVEAWEREHRRAAQE